MPCRSPIVTATSLRHTAGCYPPDPTVRQRAAHAGARGSLQHGTGLQRPAWQLDSLIRYSHGYARIVTHYVRHNAWLGDGEYCVTSIGLRTSRVLVNGRFDFQAPIATAWESTIARLARN